MIAVREFTSAAECIAHAQAVHRKFFAQPAAVKRAEAPAKKHEPLFVPRFFHQTPSWKLETLYFDAHVREWREELMSVASPMEAYIRKRAVELGFTYSAVVSKARTRELSYARHLIMWEMKRILRPAPQKTPGSISYPELGRLFGGLDHSSCYHAISRIDALKGTPLQAKEGE